MGYDNENSSKLVFDIETAPLAEAVDYIEQASAPANYKDEEKIKAYVAEKTAENLERCGLDVDLCRVVAIGFQVEGARPAVLIADEDNAEADILKRFWRITDGRHLVGFNCLGFDLPVLLRRSLYLGVKTPHIAIDKYRHPQVTDLMQLLSFNGTLKFRGLSFYAKRFGLAVQDTMTGADIAKAVRERRWADVEAHVLADVEKTMRLAERVGCFSALEVAL